jgi:putative ABC transport system permease protein
MKLTLFAQELFANRIRLAFLSLCLGVGFAGLSSVTSYTNQIKNTLSINSRLLFGGDVSVSDIRAIENPQRFTSDKDIQSFALISQMTAMASNPKSGLAQLVNVRGVDFQFPLLPESLKLEPQLKLPMNLQDASFDHGALVANALLQLWGMKVGDPIQIAGTTYTVRAAIMDDATQAASFFAFGPAIIVRRVDAAAQGLLANTSRFRETLTVLSKADPLALALKFRKQLEPNASLRVATHLDSDRGPGRVLSNLSFFLSQLTLSTFLLVCLGLATCLTEFIRSKRNDTAIYRVMGASPQLPVHVLGGVIICLSVVGVLLGIAGGELLRAFLLLPLLNDALPIATAPFSMSQIPFLAAVSATAIPFLFVLPSLSRLQATSPATVLRGGETVSLPLMSSWSGPAIALAILVYHFASGSPKPFVGLVIFALNIMIFASVRVFLNWLISSASRRNGTLPLVVELAIGEISARKFTALLTMSLIGMGTFFVALMLFVQSNLEASVAADISQSKKPNVYFLDVQKSQSEAVKSSILQLLPSEQNISSSPMVRARLLKINGVNLEYQLTLNKSKKNSKIRSLFVGGNTDEAEEDSRAMRQREQNLTWRDVPGPAERVIAGGSEGGLWKPEKPDQVSLEKRFAERIGATLGSTLSFSISGVPLSAQVTSIREVNWQSFQPNFFIVMHPGLMTDVPHQVLLSVHADTESTRQRIQQEIAGAFPNISVIDATEILKKAGQIAQGVSKSSGTLAALLVLAALLILAASLYATGAARRRNAAILRTLGAKATVIRKAIFLEFSILGGLSAALGVAGAQFAAWVILTTVLEIQSELSFGSAILLWAAATGSAIGLGYLSGRSVLVQKPAQTLRELS